ncbi:hypothetical protein BFW01_g7799 [Lasiodiplodia theobromae]|nr:hypothetical protein BFW01_g7799 [Lasiodiplodia theobromae]
MLESRQHVKHQDPPYSLLWLDWLAPLVEDAGLPPALKEKLIALLVQIRRQQLSERVRGYYYREIGARLLLYIEHRNMFELQASWNLLSAEVRDEAPFDGAYVPPTVYVDRAQPGLIWVVPVDTSSSQHQHTGSIREEERVEKSDRHPSHTDGPADPTKNLTKQASKQPRELVPGQRPKRRLLNHEPVSRWGISEPVFVAIDIGAHEIGDHTKITSVGVSALDSREYPPVDKLTSLSWMRASAPSTRQLRIAVSSEEGEKLYGSRSSYGRDVIIRNPADIRDVFVRYMRECFGGRNVVLTFHDAINDHKWMKELGMDPYSIDGVDIVGEFDTMIAARCRMEYPNLGAALNRIGYQTRDGWSLLWYTVCTQAVT